MRVDFGGTTDGLFGSTGSYSGFFIYDDTGLDLNGSNLANVPGLEIELSFVDGVEIFDETTASVFSLGYSGGNLISWRIGGDNSGSIFSTGVVPDMVLTTSFGVYEFFSFQQVGLDTPKWSVSPVAVPEPSTMGLYVMMGLTALGVISRRRKKQLEQL